MCIIHLSSKWINKFYEEDNFLELLKILDKKNLIIYLTSDETTKDKFHKIFNKYSSIDWLVNLSIMINKFYYVMILILKTGQV